ncbi:tol-pal system YbgF family protein [Flavobacterium sp. J27]|uniref:tetratricopeptide repeat protein n=1 Tax=Flavobacterium sp. J27 TaxID=2060419 RepID=UPI0010316350|nr:tetratricopeptide repeat protein [Flavobacterium sp. J27]
MKFKVIKIIAVVFILFAVINVTGMFFLNLKIFNKELKTSFKRNAYYSSSEHADVERYHQKIEIYTYKLDSLLEINPVQTELFADKLIQKYKNESVFYKYKAIALFDQKRYEEALQLFKKNRIKYLGTPQSNDNYRNIAICFENLKQFDSAVYYYKKASLDDSFFRIATCFETKKENDSAIYYYSILLKELESSENKIYQIKNIDFLKQKIAILKRKNL